MLLEKNNQLLDMCHLARRKNQLEILRLQIHSLRQLAYRLEEKWHAGVALYDTDQRAFWYKYGKVKTEKPKPKQSLQELLNELNVTPEEVSQLLREEKKL